MKTFVNVFFLFFLVLIVLWAFSSVYDTKATQNCTHKLYRLYASGVSVGMCGIKLKLFKWKYSKAQH